MPIAAVTVIVSVKLTGLLLIVKVPVDEPEEMTTVAEPNCASVLLTERFTVVPDGPAAGVIVTVPVLVLPPTIELGLKVKLVTWNGLTVRVVVCDVVPRVAVSVTD